MADENLQPAQNVPRLFIWPQQVAQRKQQQQQQSEDLTQQSTDQTQQSIVLESNTFDETDQSEIAVPALDGLDRPNEDTFADDLAGKQSSQQIDTTRNELQLSIALIEEVRRYPCVWNVTLNSNKDKPKKMEAWRRIAGALNQPVSTLTKEFDRLKDNYRRCIRKREKMTRSGCAGTKLPTCEYFVELSFLRDIVTGRKTDSNIPSEITAPSCSASSIPSLANTVTDRCSTQSDSSSYDERLTQNARKRRSDQIDELLAISLSNDLKSEKKEATHKTEQDQDQVALLCASLVKTFQNLKRKQNKRAKMKVLQVLLDFEEDDDDDMYC